MSSMAVSIKRMNEGGLKNMTRTRNSSLMMLALAFVVVALAVPAHAGIVSGSINESGEATVTPTSLTFCSSGTEVSGSCPGTAGTTSWVVPASATNSFCNSVSSSCTSPTGLFNYQLDSVTITTLNTTNAPVGTLLPGNGITFVTFNPTAGLPSPAIQLNLTELFAGTGNAANCLTGVGVCTPTGSSINFINTSGNTSSATISASGLAESETGQFSPMSIVFSAQFGESEQAVLSAFAAGSNSFTASYSGTFTAGAVPEPTTSMLMGSGLLAFAFMLRRKRS